MKSFWQKIKYPILALAPMAGVTDSAFRQICRKCGADVVYTEMVSADGLYYDSKKTLEFLKFNKKEKPVVIQLFGKDPAKFTKAAQAAERAGFSGIDINFGCPAKKVAGHGGGVTLMRDLKLCREIIEKTLAGTKLPVSVKLRSSINQESIARVSARQKQGRPALAIPAQEKVTALDFIRFMKDLPIAAVMVHGRSYEKPFDGEIDYQMIKAVKNEFSGIVLANGGIKTPEDAKKMLAETGADGLGLARGIYGRPWLFNQIKKYLKIGKLIEPTRKEIFKIVLAHAKLAEKSKEAHGIIELRKHLLWYVAGWPGAKEMRSQLVRVESVKDVKKILK